MPPKNVNENEYNNLNDLMFKYQNNPQLLQHILLAKAEEDKRLTAEEWRQKEEAILQSKYFEYEINHNKDNMLINVNQNNTIDDHQDMDASFLFGKSLMPMDESSTDNDPMVFDEHPPMQLPSDFYFMPTDSVLSMTSASSPSLEITSSPVYEHQDIETTPEFELPPNAFQTTHNRSHSSPSLPKQGNTTIIKSKSGRSIVHRTLSYENVMNLEEYNTKIMHEISINKQKKKEQKRVGSLSPPMTEPLDHEKVMEALRAKLKRASLPYPPCRKPSPEHHHSRRSPSPPPPPPPKTFPTTGVLLLNLNNRRRKQSKK